MRLSLALRTTRYVLRVNGEDVREFKFGLDKESRKAAKALAEAFGEGWSEACLRIGQEVVEAMQVDTTLT